MDLQQKTVLFCNTRTHWRSSFLVLSGIWRRSTTTRETKLLMLCHILHIPYLDDIIDADTCSGRSLTDNWWGNGFGTEPMLPCIFHRLPPWWNFLAARLQIGNYGASFHTNCSPRIKPSTILNSICGSDSSVQHANSNLREKFLCVNRGWRTKSCTHATAPFTLLMVDCNPIQRHSKDGMQLWRTPHHQCCQLEDLKQHIS